MCATHISIGDVPVTTVERSPYEGCMLPGATEPGLSCSGTTSQSRPSSRTAYSTNNEGKRGRQIILVSDTGLGLSFEVTSISKQCRSLMKLFEGT